MMYSFSEVQKLNDKFYSIFGVGFQKFYDGLMSVLFKRLCIDILKFDDWLHEKYGDYEENGQSMKEIIYEKYGEKGVKLIEDLI